MVRRHISRGMQCMRPPASEAMRAYNSLKDAYIAMLRTHMVARGHIYGGIIEVCETIIEVCEN